jgi:hypothetical protein
MTKKDSMAEKIFIKMWGVPHDKQFDLTRLAFFPETNFRITSLILAFIRSEAIKKAEKRKASNNRNYI